jgi:hypothetical protein
MMKKTQQKNPLKTQQNNPYNVNYDNYMESNSSATECTGLIPIENEDRTEWEHYRELYHFGGYE